MFIEHGHRLLGAIVGLLAIGFVISVFCSDSRRWLKVLAVLVLALVCLQGALGGMRVVLDQRTLAMIHACVGPAFFALTVVLAAVSSHCWSSIEPVSESMAHRVQRLAVITTVLAYLQLILAPSFATRHWMQRPVSSRALHFHLLIAAALLVHVVLVVRATLRVGHPEKRLSFPAVSLLVLMALQIALGIGTWVVKYGWPRWLGEHTWTMGYTVQREDLLGSLVITAHVGIGSAILASALLLAVRSFRYLKAEGLDGLSCERNSRLDKHTSATPTSDFFVRQLAEVGV